MRHSQTYVHCLGNPQVLFKRARDTLTCVIKCNIKATITIIINQRIYSYTQNQRCWYKHTFYFINSSKINPQRISKDKKNETSEANSNYV